jgi:hypothetical protein
LTGLIIVELDISTHNYWVFGLFPLSGILGTRKFDVSETGSASVLRCGGKKPEDRNRSSNSDCDTPSPEPIRIYSDISSPIELSNHSFKVLKKWITVSKITLNSD